MARTVYLNQVELDALLAWLAPCRDQAGEHYEAIRRDLLKFFTARNCDAAEEHVDETIDRVARRVAGGERIQAEPRRYCRGVAKKIFLEHFKRRGRTFGLPSLLQDALPSPPERTVGVADCLRALPQHARELLEGYYLDDRAALAATLGISPNALRLRVFKEKRRLRAALARTFGEPRCIAPEIFDAKSPLGSERPTRADSGAPLGRKEVTDMRPMVRAMVVAAAALALTAVLDLRPGPAVQVASAQDVGAGPDVQPQAGFVAPVGGAVRGMIARTQTTATALAEGAVWRNLPGAVLSRVVAAGTTDLFNIAFSSECQVRSVGNGDTARIRIAHAINGVAAAPIEPYDGDQRFCSSANPLATHSALWAQRLGAGNHTLQVQVMTVDFAPDNGAITSVFDDWTYEVVIYD